MWVNAKKLLYTSVITSLFVSNSFGNEESILILKNPNQPILVNETLLKTNELPTISKTIKIPYFSDKCNTISKNLDNSGDIILGIDVPKGFETKKIVLKDNKNYIKNLINNNLNKRVSIRSAKNSELKVEGTIVNNDPLIIRGELQDILKYDNHFFFFDEKLNLDESNFEMELCKSEDYKEPVVKKTKDGKVIPFKDLSITINSIVEGLKFNTLPTNISNFNLVISNTTNKDFTFDKVIFKDKTILNKTLIHTNQKLLLKLD